jgi:hypothetical protein
MMSSTTGFLDILNPFTWNLKRRITGTDDSFSDALKQYPELWRELFSGPNIICCPVSGSLRDEVTKEQLMSHILLPQRSGGEYKTIRGEQVHYSGSELVCGMGFIEPREVKVMSMSQLTDSSGKTVTVFRINRPLVGGILAPDDAGQV